jgi:hypothetical protein
VVEVAQSFGGEDQRDVDNDQEHEIGQHQEMQRACGLDAHPLTDHGETHRQGLATDNAERRGDDHPAPAACAEAVAASWKWPVSPPPVYPVGEGTRRWRNGVDRAMADDSGVDAANDW